MYFGSYLALYMQFANLKWFYERFYESNVMTIYTFLFNFNRNQQIKVDRNSVQVTGMITEPPKITKEINSMVQNDFMDMYQHMQCKNNRKAYPYVPYAMQQLLDRH